MANRGAHGDNEPRDDRAHDDQVHLVTSANKPHSQEMSERAKKYLISMGIRTACVVLAIFVFQGWLRLIAIVGALVLPWFAVVVANAGPIRGDEEPEFVDLRARQIEAGASGTLEAPRDEPSAPDAEAAANDTAAHDDQPSARMGPEPPRQRRPFAS